MYQWPLRPWALQPLSHKSVRNHVRSRTTIQRYMIATHGHFVGAGALHSVPEVLLRPLHVRSCAHAELGLMGHDVV